MADVLAASWNEWIGLLETSGFAVRELLQRGASDVDLLLLEQRTGLTLTDEVRALYQLSNGQRIRPTLGMVRDGRAEPWPPNGAPVFGFYEFLSTLDAADSWQGWKDIDTDQGPDGMADMAEFVEVSEPDKVKRAYWLPGWIPFSRDGGGNSYAFDFDPEPQGTMGQIIIIGSDEDHRRVLAPSISAFLDSMASEWHAGRYEIESQDEGVNYYDLPYLRGESS